MMSEQSRWTTRAKRAFTLSFIALLVATLSVGTASAQSANSCYLVADDGNGSASGSDGGAEDLLTAANPDDADPATNESSIGTTGSFNVEAIALQPSTGDLFAVDANQLGTIDVATGAFSPKASTIGSGSGANGSKSFSDVDGIIFDPADGTLFGLSRQQGSEVDLLIKINPSTGSHVADAFGAGVDYVVIDPIGSLTNGDDLAIAADGTMYGILSDGGQGDHLVTIDTSNGNTTDVGATGVNDVEGLSFAPDGRLLGSTGQESSEGEAIWTLSTATGAASAKRPLDNAGDYEAIACFAEETPGPSPSPSVSPTESVSPGPSVSPTASPTVLGTKEVAETGSGAVPFLAALGLTLLVAGVAVRRLAVTR